MKKSISSKLLLLLLGMPFVALSGACGGASEELKINTKPQNPGGDFVDPSAGGTSESDGKAVVYDDHGTMTGPGLSNQTNTQTGKLDIPNPTILPEYENTFGFTDDTLEYPNPDQTGLKNYTKYENIYLKELINHLNIDSYMPTYNKYDSSFISEFNNKSKQTYQPFFRDAFLKNFSIPDPTNSYLILNPLRHDLKRAYYDSYANDRGKPRYLANEHYKNAALETFEIKFNNTNKVIEKGKNGDFLNQAEGRLFNGTAWILDYVPTEDGSYPTKWYIATNLHVVMPFRKANVSGEPYSNPAKSEEEAENLRKWNVRYNQMQQEYEAAKLKMEEIKLKTGENDKEYLALLNKYTIPDGATPSAWIVEYNEVLKAKKAAEAEVYGETTSITLNKFRTDVPLRRELSPNDWDPRIDSVTIFPHQVKIVYAATDFLNQSPKDYLSSNDPNYNYEEMVDFAILEIDFAKQPIDSWEKSLGYNQVVADGTKTFFKVDSVQKLAEDMTNDYAGSRSSKHSGMANYDVLTDYDRLSSEKVTVRDGDEDKQVSKINVNFVAVGFPRSDTDYDLNTQGLDRYNQNPLYTASLWTNKPRSNDKGVVEYGHSLSKNFAFRNFVNKPGATDLTITLPIFNRQKNEPFSVQVFKDPKSSYQKDKYITYGLGYILTNWQPMGGSSGSSIRDIDGNILAINFASGDSLGNTLINISQALRSNGYDYQGQYGRYNLEQYDLIYGGGKNQKTSYRQALEKLYGSNFKTNLFPQGTSVIPDKYKFAK